MCFASGISVRVYSSHLGSKKQKTHINPLSDWTYLVAERLAVSGVIYYKTVYRTISFLQISPNGLHLFGKLDIYIRSAPRSCSCYI